MYQYDRRSTAGAPAVDTLGFRYAHAGFCEQLYASVLTTRGASSMTRRGRKPTCACGECKKCRRRAVVQRHRARQALQPERTVGADLVAGEHGASRRGVVAARHQRPS